MAIILAVFASIVVAILVMGISVRFEEPVSQIGVKSVIYGLSVFLIYSTHSLMSNWLLAVMFIWLLVLMGYLIYWWLEEGSTVKEMLYFVGVDLIVMFAELGAIAKVSAGIPIRWLAGILNVLPVIALVMSVAFFLANMLMFKAKLEEFDEEFDEDSEEGGEEHEGEVKSSLAEAV